MSVPARQTKNVDLMRDDPERLLDVSEAAALLHVKNKTLYAWVSRNKIPYRKICSLLRFHRGELIEWAKGPTAKCFESNTKVSNRGRVALLLSDGC